MVCIDCSPLLKIDELASETTHEKSATREQNASSAASSKKDFDAVEFMKEERRKLLIKLERTSGKCYFRLKLILDSCR